MAVTVSDLNPFGKFDVGVGAIGNALILFAISVTILGLVGWLIYWRIVSKQYKFKIPLYKSINGTNFKQAYYVAKNVPISKAGDSLWFVKGIKKFIAPANLTDAPNEYPHEEREDGEWINFSIDSVNDQQKKAGVRFIQQDMRTQRVATAQILEQRLINKGFWEKYKDLIIHLIFYIIVTLLMIVTFWQWGNIVDRIGGLLSNVEGIAENLNKLECIGQRETGIIPAILLLFFRSKK
jgi:hypothetical protein